MRNFQQPRRSPSVAINGLASSSHTLATGTALAILQKGGNAMDAALSAVAVQCVVEPGSTSIGGDCFCLYAQKGSDDIVAFNGSGRAPQALSISHLQQQGLTTIPQHSPHAVTIPGAVDAWVRLHQDYGRLPFTEILAPAIHYATEGYAIGQRTAYDFAQAEETLKSDPDTKRTFLIGDTLPKMGDRHHQPILAETLHRIAQNGRDGFYSGVVRDDILHKLQSLGGVQTEEDFALARGEYVTPISTDFRGFRVWQCPPNGQGVIALQLLNMASLLDKFGESPLCTARIHHEIEIGRMAYRDRGLYLGDAEYMTIDVEAMLDAKHAERLCAQIDPLRALRHLQACPLPKHPSTVYITVIDKERNACSLINTVFHAFGSGIMAPQSGVLLQSRGVGFTLKKDHPNSLAGGKRPLHTIIPAMVTKNGRLEMSYGVMGGEYQAFGHMQFLSRLYDYGLDIQAAQDAPRFFPDPYSNRVDLETPIPQQIFTELRDMGHNIAYAKTPIGGAQAIRVNWQQNTLIGGSDPRKDGCALGY